jgi:hypothetical protein
VSPIDARIDLQSSLSLLHREPGVISSCFCSFVSSTLPFCSLSLQLLLDTRFAWAITKGGMGDNEI